MLIDENNGTPNGQQRSEQADASGDSGIVTSVETVTRPEPADFERRLAENWPAEVWRDSHVVLAISGGADSVALLRAIAGIKARYGGSGQLFAAHLNHGLRGDEADADAAWVAGLCERIGVPLQTAKADISSLAAEQGDGWEAAARDARYDFLRQTAERVGARYVATAHTADDQAETVLHRILRGTGLTGLAGISAARPLSTSVALVRPMLSLRQQDVVGYLTLLGQDFRTDPSNDDARFTRNRLRHELLPLLRERYNSDVDGALSRLARQASEVQRFLEGLAATLACDCVTIEFDSIRGESRRGRLSQIDCRKLENQPAIIVREVCKIAWRDAGWSQQAMGFHEWQLLAGLVGGDYSPKTANMPNGVRARREQHLLILEAPSLP